MPTIQFFQPEEGRTFDGPLDLNTHLVRHPAATFFMRAASDADRETGIRTGDLLVIDRAAEPRAGDVVIVARAGELRLERLRASREGNDETEFWGVVTHAVREL